MDNPVPLRVPLGILAPMNTVTMSDWESDSWCDKLRAAPPALFPSFWSWFNDTIRSMKATAVVECIVHTKVSASTFGSLKTRLGITGDVKMQPIHVYQDAAEAQMLYYPQSKKVWKCGETKEGTCVRLSCEGSWMQSLPSECKLVHYRGEARLPPKVVDSAEVTLVARVQGSSMEEALANARDGNAEYLVEVRHTMLAAMSVNDWMRRTVRDPHGLQVTKLEESVIFLLNDLWENASSFCSEE